MISATRIVSRLSVGRWPTTAIRFKSSAARSFSTAKVNKTSIKFLGLYSSNPSSIRFCRYLSTSKTRFARQNIVCPPLAESLSEGDIKFEKQVGDVVSEDDLLASVETDKTSIPINSPIAGKILELLVEDSSTVKPGQDIMVIDTDAGTTSKPSADSNKPKDSEPKTTHAPAISTPPPPPPPAPTAQHIASPPTPQVQPLQHQAAISVESIKSELDELTNRGQFGGQVSPQSRNITSVKMNRMRQRIATRLKDAQNTYAMLTTFNEIDMSNLMEMRQRYKESFLKKHAVKLGFMSAFVKASAYALKDQPVVNAVIEDNQILYRDYTDISVAVATPKGLVVPVLRNVDQMNFADVEKNINLLGEKAKNNALTVADMEGGTFTISNGGVFGSLFGTPIINPPQSAILGMHSIKEKPIAVNGQVVIRPIMVVALTYDHRLIDGREAVTFLKKIVDIIEDPRIILLDL